MKTYRRKTATVQAVKFTEAVGREVMAFQADPDNGGATHPLGVQYSEGYGYNLNGQTLTFDNYVVVSHGNAIVMSKSEFEAQYEPAS